jgi:single-strand DNA-binding protein
MAGNHLNYLQLEGRLTQEGVLRFTPQGHAVCDAAMAYTPRRQNKTTQKWEDGESSFFDIVAWRQVAETLAEIPKGTLIQVFGSISKHYWTSHENNRREKVVITVDQFSIPVISSKGFTVDDNQNMIFHRFSGRRVKDLVEQDLVDHEERPF